MDQVLHSTEYLEDEIWDIITVEMLKGVDSAKHGFHSFCLANVNGLYPESRTVILRNFLPEEKCILFHTDIRSPKCEQIKNNPRAVAVFYDKLLKVQLRFKANAYVHHLDDLAARCWDVSAPQSRRTYLKTYPPGSIIQKDDLIFEPEFIYRNPRNDESNMGIKNFAVVKLEFYSIDILLLNSTGNESFRLEWREEDNKRILYHTAP